MALLDRLTSIDVRIIYVVIGVSVLVPILMPLGLPVTVTPSTRSAFDAVETLPAGSRVLVSFDYGPSTAPENDQMARIATEFPAKKDTIDFVNLGYKDGGQAPMKKMGEDIPGTYPVDAAGRPYQDLPIVHDVTGYKDFK